MFYVLWHVDSLLDNTHNTHTANSVGTVFPSSVDGLLLCNSRTVTSHNSSGSRSRDMFTMTRLSLGYICECHCSVSQFSKLVTNYEREIVSGEASELEPGLQKNTGCRPVRNVKCDWKILCVIFVVI
jgi:hypothetical protein